MMVPATRRLSFPILFGLVVLGACGGDDAPPPEAATEVVESAPVTATPSLEVATSLGVTNARMPLPGLVTAGQVTQEQFDAMAQAGYQHFVSLRLPTESGAGWEEAHAPSAGVAFTRIPVAGSGDLTRAAVDELARALDAAGDEGTVVYCASSNRVGALLALKAHWVDGMSAEEALELGRAGGMTRLEPAVMELLGISGS